jgi:general secretion pathway protein D
MAGPRSPRRESGPTEYGSLMSLMVDQVTRKHKQGVAWAALVCLMTAGCAHEALPPSASHDLPATPQWRDTASPSWRPPSLAPPATGVIDFGHSDTVTNKPDAWHTASPGIVQTSAPEILPDRVSAKTADPAPVDEKRIGSLHIDNLDIHKAMEIISREGGFNILVAPGVKGTVRANLKDVTPTEALDAILNLTNLVKKREGGLIYIYTAEEMRGGLGPDQWISTCIYHLNYVRSTDLESMIAPFLSEDAKLSVSPPSAIGIQASGASGGGQGSGGHSGGGSGATSGGSGQSGQSGGGHGGASTGGNLLAGGEVLIVQDRVSVLRTIDHIVREVDVPPLQVQIEAVILSVEHDHTQEVGVNFAVVDTTGNVLGVIGDGAKLAATVGLKSGVPIQLGGTGGATATTAVGAADGFIHDEHGLKFGATRGGTACIIRALKSTGKVDILARPQLLVLNKQQASLLLGARLGYSTLSQSAVSTTQQVQFLNVGTQLRVRPFISDHGLIRMEVNPERSSGRIVDNIPQATTTEVTTNVMVPDGATLVIGGLVDDEKDRSQNGLPILGECGAIGAFFRERFVNHTRRELVVLLTPHIWTPSPHLDQAPVYHAGSSVTPEDR